MAQKKTRREFLRTGAAAAGLFAAPAIVPSSVFGKSAPSERVGLGLLGCGRRSGELIRNFVRYDDAQFVAVCDPFRKRRESMAKQLEKQTGDEGIKPYEDLREMLDRDDIDAVIIGTHDHWHVHMAAMAARKGKDVYVEKPLSSSLEWSKKLRPVLKENKTIFQYGTQYRSHRAMRQVCQLVRNGYIGDLKSVEVWAPDMSKDQKGFKVKPWGSTKEIPVPEDLNYDLWVGPASMIPYNEEACNRFVGFHCYNFSNGFLGGWGAHPLDIAVWGLGPDRKGPVKCRGTGTIPKEGLFRTVYGWDASFEYADGVELVFRADPKPAKEKVGTYRMSHGTTFHGTEGWISVDRRGARAEKPEILKIQLKDSDTRLYESPGHGRNFLDCVKNRKETACPFEEAFRSDLISQLTNVAVRTGREFAWDPAKEVIVGDAEAQAVLDRPMREPWKI